MAQVSNSFFFVVRNGEPKEQLVQTPRRSALVAVSLANTILGSFCTMST